MAWNAATDPLPTARELAEPHRRLDELLDYLGTQTDAADLAAWFAEGLTSAYRLPMTVGDPNPVAHVRKLSEALLWVMHIEGDTRERRLVLSRVAIEHIDEIRDQLRYWRDESQRASFSRRWGPPVRVPTSPMPRSRDAG